MSNSGLLDPDPDEQALMGERLLVVTTNQQGLVESLQCPGKRWKLEGLGKGQQLPEMLEAVIDASEDSTRPQLFPYVQLADGLCVDIHVINFELGTQVILQDISQRVQAEQSLQQEAHELSLKLERQAELIRRLQER